MPFDNLPELKPALRPEQRVLLDAARYLEEHGWCQRALVESDGRVCMLGALNAVCGGDPEDSIERFKHLGFRPALNALSARVGSIVDFNNAEGRTEAEVIAAMRAAAGEG